MAEVATPGVYCSAEPQVININGFIIEAYASITDVPYATVSEYRGKSLKTPDHERPDELYGRCRICMGDKSGEPLLLCDDCDRAFHTTCLVPVLREIPKGEWHCPKCTRDRLHNAHERATAVANLRNVLRDIHTRPTLPPKLQHKLLDLSRPARPTPPTTPPLPRPSFRLRSLPPKFRMKRSARRLVEPPPPPPIHRVRSTPAMDRLRNISRLAGDLRPVVGRFAHSDLGHSLYILQKRLACSKKSAIANVIDTRNSHNPLSRARLRRLPMAQVCDGEVVVRVDSEVGRDALVEAFERGTRKHGCKEEQLDTQVAHTNVTN